MANRNFGEVLGTIPLRTRVLQLTAMYGRLERRILKDIASLVSNYTERKARELLSWVEARVNELNVSMYGITEIGVSEAFDKALRFSDREFKKLGVERKYFLPGEEKKLKRQTTDEAYTFYFKAHESLLLNVKRYIRAIRDYNVSVEQLQEFSAKDAAAVDEIIEEAIFLKKSRGYARKRILAYFKRKLKGGQLITINGRNYKLSKYVNLITRTEFRTAQTRAIIMRAKEYDNDLVEWSSHADPCPICEEYEGNVYSLSGTDLVYPLLIEVPPIHPHCEHTIYPVTRAALDARAAA